MPLKFLDEALFWYQRGKLKRRLAEVDSGFSQRQVFPSWSWSGWIGPVPYLHTSVERTGDAQGEIETFNLLDGDNMKLSSKAQHLANAPQCRSWTLSTLDAGVVQKSDILMLRFSAKCFRLGSFRFDIDPFSSKNELPISRILDTRSRQCGILFDGAELGSLIQGTSLLSLDSYYFIILSYTTKRLSRKSGFTLYTNDGYIEPFAGEYATEQGPWRCVNLMLVVRDGALYERVAIGMIHEKALSDLDMTTETIQLM